MKLVTALLVICVLALATVGMVVLYSLSPAGSASEFVPRQVIAFGLGLVGAGVVAAMSPRHFKAVSPWLLGLAVVMLILVLIPGVGVKVNGARRWFRLLGFQFQPSDFVKLSVILFLAHYGAHYQRLMRSAVTGLLVPGAIVLFPMGLIFLEPDWGTALLIGGVSAVMLLIAGAKWHYMLAPAVVGLAGVAVMLWLDPIRSDRYHSWRNLEETKAAKGYQAWQARIALGSGGLTGKGLDHSTRKEFVPEKRTDFIFAIIGEEFGYVGAVGVLSCFLILFLCGIYIAWRAPDPFGMLLAAGISFLISLQSIANLAVVSSLIPNKGIALPFVSYGGSNLIMMMISVGALISVARTTAGPAMADAPHASLSGAAVTRLT